MSIDCSLTHLSIGKEIIKSVRKSIVEKKLRKLTLSILLYNSVDI